MASSLRALRGSLVAGAIYDLALGFWILFYGLRFLSGLGYAPGGSSFLFHMAALPLLLLPVLYVSAARAKDTKAFRPAVLWARGGGGAVLLMLVLVHRPEAGEIYALLGVADLVWATLHALLWRKGG